RVRRVTGAEQERRLGMLELGELLLEAAVDRHVARDQPRGSGARAVAHGGLGSRLAHARVIGQTEVVVGAQEEHGLPFEQDARPRRPRAAAHAPVEALVPNLLEALVDVCAHAARLLSAPPAAGSTWISSGYAFGAPSGR